MLYHKNEEAELSKQLFQNPTCEYRGAPFWAWNGKMDEAECLAQTEVFRAMGFGGYFMHPRTGLAVPYLGKKFNSCVKTCVDAASEKGMLAWLYDEDRWPSGFGGGYVTKDGKFRQKFIWFTPFKLKETAKFKDGVLCGGTHLIATYAMRFAGKKCVGYSRIKDGKKAFGKKFYAYFKVAEPSDIFGGGGYVDALNPAALNEFAKFTYGTYQKNVGEAFGGTVPAIFTDEPQMKAAKGFKSALFPICATIPWTDDFEKTYEESFGTSVLDTLPEVFFDVAGSKVSQARYRYHLHRSERFATAFSDNLGKKCEALGLKFTGHLMEEPTLYKQSKSVGEAMRQYKHFGLPGMDLLCGRHEYNTAKQVQSVVRQEGKEGMLAELYGVSRWNATFGKFKEEGDWLACLGVTVRVPHLSLYTMKGEAKRDYPPSISYQTPWHEKYALLENHFARLNTALTRGSAVCDIAVIHPIESYWTVSGADDCNVRKKKLLDKHFAALTENLLYNGYDFDFVSESLLPCQVTDNPLAVGKCSYKTVIVPELVTVRRTTLDFLEKFAAAGGKVIVLGSKPAFVDATAGASAGILQNAMQVKSYGELLAALDGNSRVKVTCDDKNKKFISQLRKDADGLWLFVTSPEAKYAYPKSTPVCNPSCAEAKNVRIEVKGQWYTALWDTMSGNVTPLAAVRSGEATVINCKMHARDSLLLRLDRAGKDGALAEECAYDGSTALCGNVKYTLSEPNVLLLDRARWSVNGKWHRAKDMQEITSKARKALGLGKYRADLQPWQREPVLRDKQVHLAFEFDSKIDGNALFGTEYDEYRVWVNGNEVTAAATGYYVDKCIKTLPVNIKKGKNTVEVTVALNKYDRLENCYLLGDFGVWLKGSKAVVGKLPQTIFFGDITAQGLPFYGGKLTYVTAFEGKKGGAKLHIDYNAALVEAKINGKITDVMLPPYDACFAAKDGLNTVELTAYISRENAFGTVHIRNKYKLSDSPKWYKKTGLKYKSKRYILDKCGIMKAPQLACKA